MIKGKAIIEIEDKDKEAEIIYKAILPEVESSPSDRSKTIVEVDKGKLKIVVNSKDASSFRASIGSYMRWIRLSYKIKEGLK